MKKKRYVLLFENVAGEFFYFLFHALILLANCHIIHPLTIGVRIRSRALGLQRRLVGRLI